MNVNGRDDLLQVLRRAGFPSLEQAVAHHALFVHPDTVSQTRNEAIFAVIRNFSERGKIIVDGLTNRRVMACDNDTPTLAFEWASGLDNYQDVQFNHVYSASNDVGIYTSLANLCVTPTFLAKLTDQDSNIIATLKYRVYDIYGFVPQNMSTPSKPNDYDQLRWRSFPEAQENLANVMINRLGGR